MTDQIDYASLPNSEVTPMSEAELELGLTCDNLSVGRINYVYQKGFDHFNCNELQIKGAIEASGETYDPNSCNQLAGAIEKTIIDMTLPSSRSIIYVDSINGSDSNDGSTELLPIKTLSRTNLINKVSESNQNLAADLELRIVDDIVDGVIDYPQSVFMVKANTNTMKIKSDSKIGLSVNSDLTILDSFDWENGEFGTLTANAGQSQILLVGEDATLRINADQNFKANTKTAVLCRGQIIFASVDINLFNQPTGVDSLNEFLKSSNAKVTFFQTIISQQTDFIVASSLFFCERFSVITASSGVTYNANAFAITGSAFIADLSIIDRDGAAFNPSGTIADQEIFSPLIR